LHHETILVVDDEKGDRGLMARLLRKQGYHVLLAGNYYEASRKAREARNRIRLLITDVALPGSDGFELAQSIGRLTNRILDVLFISGEAGSRILPYYGLPKTDAHFLRKPFSSAELLKRVAQLLHKGPRSPGAPLRWASRHVV
jgi:DNA-binding response OmpR family regulator